MPWSRPCRVVERDVWRGCVVITLAPPVATTARGYFVLTHRGIRTTDSDVTYFTASGVLSINRFRGETATAHAHRRATPSGRRADRHGHRRSWRRAGSGLGEKPGTGRPGVSPLNRGGSARRTPGRPRRGSGGGRT